MKSYAIGCWRSCSRIEADRQIAATAFGRGVFTTLGVSDGRPWFLEEHLERLESEARRLGFQPGRLLARWRDLVREGLWTNRMKRGVIRLGADLILREARPFALFEHARRTPQAVILQKVEVDAPPRGGYVKSQYHASWSSYRDQARTCGCFDVLIVRRGRLTETSRCNLFLDLGDSLATPPEAEVFPGIARRVMLAHPEVPGLVRSLDWSDLLAARQVILTNSVRGVLAVSRVLDSNGRTAWRSREKSAARLVMAFQGAVSRS